MYVYIIYKLNNIYVNPQVVLGKRYFLNFLWDEKVNLEMK